MGLSKLDNLYRQVILDHSSHPHHRGSLTDSTSKIELNNPTCGDVIELQVDVKDGIIKNIAFDGSGLLHQYGKCLDDDRRRHRKINRRSRTFNCRLSTACPRKRSQRSRPIRRSLLCLVV